MGGLSVNPQEIVNKIITTYGLNLKTSHVQRVVNELSKFDVDLPTAYSIAKSLLDIGESYFFRDMETWSAIKYIMENEREKDISVLSLGCSEGEEAYTFSFVAKDVFKKAHILGIDANEKRIQKAERGIYEKWKLRALEEDQIEKYFITRNEAYEVKSVYRSGVEFKVYNIIQMQFEEKYDFIFARRILIYLDEKYIKIIAQRVANSLKDNGYLVLGKGEVYEELLEIFEPVKIKNSIFWRVKRKELSEEEEISIFENVIKDSIYSYEEIVKKLVNKKLYEEALLWIENAKNEGIESPELFKYEISIYLNLNMKNKALHTLKKALNMFPYDEELQKLEGLII